MKTVRFKRHFAFLIRLHLPSVVSLPAALRILRILRALELHATRLLPMAGLDGRLQCSLRYAH